MDDSKKKILVVEDEKSISDIIRYNLEKEGFSVYAAYDLSLIHISEPTRH